MEKFQYGTHFIYEKQEYCVIGTDCSSNEIECVTVPYDNKIYWFKVVNNNEVCLID